MGKTKVITFTTRDSLPLHGYCTLPVGGNAPYPTVVLLHGGPHLRDYWGFDPTVQLLASRGYAVLQINYRGSEGFGFRISEKEKYDFKKMYCDVFDGTRAVIAQGIADKNRIAIMGASFGGYLAICGVAFEPDLYRCAISEVGVFDWKRQLRSKLLNYNNYVYDYYKPYVGSNEYLDSISPIHWVKNIKAPVFLAGGYEDLTVSSYQSYSLCNKLQLAGVKVEIFIRGGEGHGFFNQKNITEYNKRVVQFIDKYMNN
jgi:dipeptidyl aminopeptidase/acylaminoacyl peptidase